MPFDMKRVYIENSANLEIFTIPGFLTDEECDGIAALADKNKFPSRIVGAGVGVGAYHEGRTSASSILPDTDPLVHCVNQKICKELGMDIRHSEPTQAQIYEVGQEFKHHHDAYEPSRKKYNLSSGQRTWTFMVYLNEVEEGGETDFREIQKIIKPVKGTALAWKNSDAAGMLNPATLHAGLPVKRGKKIIITKWFRENIFDRAEDARLEKKYHKATKGIFKWRKYRSRFKRLGLKGLYPFS